MINGTFKKRIIFLALTLIFSFSSFAQKKGKLKEFSKEFPAYLQELNVFMTASENSELKKVFKSFSKSESSLSVSEKEKIIGISNKMLDKRLRAKPHFLNFLSSLMIVNKHVKREIMLPQWLVVVDETVDDKKNVLAEVRFLTHNISKHIYNLENHKKAEELLWKPSVQETKTSNYGGKNIRYQKDFKSNLINDFEYYHYRIVPWNTIRYIF